jgi:hypothetical protein
MDLLDRLLGHDLWSTRQLLTQARGLSAAQLDQEFGIDSRTLRGCFLHIVARHYPQHAPPRPGHAHAGAPGQAGAY